MLLGGGGLRFTGFSASASERFSFTDADTVNSCRSSMVEGDVVREDDVVDTDRLVDEDIPEGLVTN